MALWTPAEITTALWIDFSDAATLFDATSGGSVVTNGVGIARTEDKSGNARHFTQSTPGARPTWASGAQNGLGVGTFDGGDWLTSISANSVWTFLHFSQSTIFAVIKPGVIANPNAVYGIVGNNAGATTNIGASYFYDDRSAVPRSDAFGAIIAQGVSGQPSSSVVVQDFFAPNATQSIAIQSDQPDSPVSDRLLSANNGSAYPAGTNTANRAPVSTAPSFALQLGTFGNNVAPLVGNFCELVIVSSLLANADRQIVDGYLHWKWGLQGNLPSDHPYKNAAPGAGGSIIPILRQHYAAMGVR